MKNILESHSVLALKKEISKTNIKGYSKMKKAEVVNLMLKHKARFSHIKHAEPKAKKEAPKPKPKPKQKRLIRKKKVPEGKVLDTDEYTLPYADVDFAPLFNERENNQLEGKEAKKWSYTQRKNPNKGGFRNKDTYDDWKERSDYINTYTSRADYIKKNWDHIRGQKQHYKRLQKIGYLQ